MSKAYKFRLYPNKAQDTEIRKHLWASKELWNRLLENTKQRYDTERKFFSRSELQSMAKNAGLYSQVSQAVAHRLHRALKAKIKAKREGKKWGFPRFKSFDNMKSLYYPQKGFKFCSDRKLRITRFGGINIKKHRDIRGKIKTLSLKREPTGKWFAIFCVEQETEKPRTNSGRSIGTDLGLINFATLSDGTIIKNPRHLGKHEERLAFQQRRLSRKNVGSNNREKIKHKLAKTHEKISNARLDFLNKTANRLLSNYSMVAMEKLTSRKMATQGRGKWVNDAGWGKFASILRYKAESAGCRVVFVDPKGTSQICSGCGALSDKTLWDRIHDCQQCGLVVNRDINAAINIFNRATAGQAGSNACGDETTVSSLKQEAHTL
ncbi:MAG: IS200/IS605 family element transposase accessory protein TnpB [Candidatus Aenigmarchaeota archaeon]|nr:IS200/IS605 family element transposase accessory protein TnpB [Candidatus Aenigmarchaeota archaeon]